MSTIRITTMGDRVAMILSNDETALVVELHTDEAAMLVDALDVAIARASVAGDGEVVF